MRAASKEAKDGLKRGKKVLSFRDQPTLVGFIYCIIYRESMRNRKKEINAIIYVLGVTDKSMGHDDLWNSFLRSCRAFSEWVFC